MVMVISKNSAVKKRKKKRRSNGSFLVYFFLFVLMGNTPSYSYIKGREIREKGKDKLMEVSPREGGP